RRRHTRFSRDWSSDVCSSDLGTVGTGGVHGVLRALVVVHGIVASKGLGAGQEQLAKVGSTRRLLVSTAYPRPVIDGPVDQEFREIGRASCRDRVYVAVVA